jgi:hypothetical protein
MNKFTNDEIFDIIVEHVCRYRQIQESSITVICRSRDFTQPRQEVMKLLKDYNPLLSLNGIAEYFPGLCKNGKKNHSTIISSIKTINNLLVYDKEFIKVHTEIKKHLDCIFYGNTVLEAKKAEIINSILELCYDYSKNKAFNQEIRYSIESIGGKLDYYLNELDKVKAEIEQHEADNKNPLSNKTFRERNVIKNL